jgi:hypothetical protein
MPDLLITNIASNVEKLDVNQIKLDQIKRQEQLINEEITLNDNGINEKEISKDNIDEKEINQIREKILNASEGILATEKREVDDLIRYFLKI